MKRVIIESPFAGDVNRNLKYLRAAMRDCLLRGESPYASHALYTQAGVLNDELPDERKLGMEAGWRWMSAAEAVVVYTDLGMSRGMKEGIALAEELKKPIEYRSIEAWKAAAE